MLMPKENYRDRHWSNPFDPEAYVVLGLFIPATYSVI